ncbi:Cache domain-containing protein [Marinospirillum celere]|uniref:Cache domain-containing protein n=1 Tax=Marinospirillum celere TaxID=1122252 RepID=A0A1I1J262_9GAMM|nr:response regulator [Marinospirillum celere]SFC39550.1 Cache domain-containing protein [Marinospirillum celere]
MSTQKNSAPNLKSWLRTSRWLGLVLPVILLVSVLFLILVVLVNLSNKSSQNTFEREAEVQVLEMANLLAEQLELDLEAVEGLGALLARQTEAAFRHSVDLSEELPSAYTKSDRGFLYADQSAEAAIFFSALEERSIEKDREQLLRFHRLEPLLQSIYTGHDLISQVYINTPTSESMIYPWLDVSSQFSPDLDVREYPFFYLADQTHNPDQSAVWMDTYLDPAGRGWMLSLLFPVAVEGELKAVVGLDITLNALVRRMMAMSPPWKGYNLLMAADGTLLAFPPQGIFHWGVRMYPANTAEGRPQLNLLLRPDLRSQLDPLRQDAAGLIPLEFRDEKVLVSWSTLDLTGWKLLLVVSRDAVFSTRQQLLDDYSSLLWQGALSLLAVCLFFVLLVSRRDYKLLQRLATRASSPLAGAKTEVTKVVPAPVDDLLYQLSGPLLICRFDAQGQVLACNKAFEHFAKSSRTALKGKPLAPLLGLTELPQENWVDELDFSSSEHENTIWWVYVAPQGTTGGVVFMLDLTSYSLTRQQLQSERQRSRQAAKMKAEFSQVVIREANSLLVELHQLAQQQTTTEHYQACRDKILAVQRLLDDLLDMSDEGDLLDEKESEQEVLNLEAWIDEARESIAAQLEQQARHLKVNKARNLPVEVITDRRKMTRLLKHLLRQTLQLASEGDLVLGVDWNPAASSLQLDLLDEGGYLLDEERIQRFQASTPLGSNYQPATGGLGMGPLLTRQLVQELKGSLEVTSRPEGGLHIHLELPVSVDEQAQVAQRILVVDDGPVNSMLATSVLEKSGYQVDAASSGRKALELGLEQDYALVLMDIFMPDMDGLETTRHWRQLPGPNAGIPVIALTANALESDRSYFIEQGLDDYLAKPYRPTELRSLVDYWMKKTRG